MFVDLIREISLFRSENFQDLNFISWLSCRPLIRDWDRRHVYDFCLGRLPETELGVTSWEYNSRLECAAHIAACLTCNEFRTNIVEIIGKALPAVPRVFFVHIPRTGGTSVQRAIENCWAGLSWHASYSSDDWFELGVRRLNRGAPLEFMLEFLAQFSTERSLLLVQGHLPLSVLLARGSIRTIDKVFALVRHPEEIILSNLAYMTEVVRTNAATPDVSDWSNWFRMLGCDWSTGTFSAQDLKKILRSRRFESEYGNPLTRYFSLNGEGFATAECLSLTDCSVLTLKSVPQYLRRHFGVDTSLVPTNGSTTNIRSRLDESDFLYLKTILCGADIPLWEKYGAGYATFHYKDELKAA